MLRLSIISTFVSQFTEFTEGKIVFLRFTKYLKIKKCFSSSVDPALRTRNTQNRSCGGFVSVLTGINTEGGSILLISPR